MSKLNCICGNELSNVCCPNNYIGYLLTDNNFESLEDNINNIIKYQIWECSECGAIAIDNPNDNFKTVLWYKPLNNKCNELMKYRKET